MAYLDSHFLNYNWHAVFTLLSQTIGIQLHSVINNTIIDDLYMHTGLASLHFSLERQLDRYGVCRMNASFICPVTDSVLWCC